ncbi:MAG TPA: hypothetical protein VJQ55_11415 [Candidatus Binatia bacterium]|nr:hypothetical protein [Candidatus Binatia bacterium]
MSDYAIGNVSDADIGNLAALWVRCGLTRPENEAMRAFYAANGYDEQKRVILAKWLEGRPMKP